MAESVESSSEATREIRYEHSRDLTDLLAAERLTILISTYQAGKVVTVGTHAGQLSLSFHNFDRPMGVAVSDDRARIAVAARTNVWLLRSAEQIARSLAPAGQFSACFLARSAHVTGEIQAHEVSWGSHEIWIVNTLFSCLCTLDDGHNFVPRWRPAWISQLAPEDRCHLNGVAMESGKPKFLSAMGQSNVAQGWRERKATEGCLIDVASGQAISSGFAMPHSPRIHQGNVWLLDSGRGALVRIDLGRGLGETVARFPGYTRGLAMHGNYAFIGLSKIRETSTFGGVPIATNRERLKCGVCILDLSTGQLVGQVEFKTGVDEIFDVQLLRDCGSVALRGPHSQEDGEPTVWIVPSELTIPPE